MCELDNRLVENIYNTTTIKELKLECETQAKVYIDTLTVSGTPVCPGIVGGWTMGYEKEDGAAATKFIRSLTCEDDETKKILLDLFEFEIEPWYRSRISLGIILMEKGEHAQTGVGYMPLYEWRVDREVYKKGCINAVTQLIRMIALAKIIPLDAHLNNILCDKDGNTTFIDFGRTYDIGHLRKNLQTTNTEFYRTFSKYLIPDRILIQLNDIIKIDVENINLINNALIITILRIALVVDYINMKTKYNETAPKLFELLRTINSVQTVKWDDAVSAASHLKGFSPEIITQIKNKVIKESAYEEGTGLTIDEVDELMSSGAFFYKYGDDKHDDNINNVFTPFLISNAHFIL